jgi:hypothetical protein
MTTIQFAKSGKTYEDTYGGWLKQLQAVAEAPDGELMLVGAPGSWHPLLWYLGEKQFDADSRAPFRRHEVEAACAAEPVLVDALWRADMRWGGTRRHIYEEAFPIATYSGFWRPEILGFMHLVRDMPLSGKTKCILLPCAADKPYPSPLHKRVRELAGHDYELIVVSSVVGCAPEGAWDALPKYDAGLPYFDRVASSVKQYFSERPYEKLVVYSDMLQHDIREGLHMLDVDVVAPFAFPKRCDYRDLLDEGMLAGLKEVL